MSLNNMLQKPDLKANDTLLLDSKPNEFPYFTNLFNRRMNPFMGEDTSKNYNFYSSLGGLPSLPPNLYGGLKTNAHEPKSKKKSKNFKQTDFKLLTEPERQLSKDSDLILENKPLLHSIEETSPQAHDLDHQQPPSMKTSFWDRERNMLTNREAIREELLTKKEEDKTEKAENICKEIALLAKEILNKTHDNKICMSFKADIESFHNIMDRINNSFLSRNHQEDINLKVFEEIQQFIRLNNKITGFEISKYRFCENFMEFMFEGTLPTIYEITQGNRNKDIIENYLSDYDEDMRPFKKESKEIGSLTQMTIMKRIIAFYIYFSKHSPNDSKGNFFLHIFFKKIVFI